MRSLRYSWVFGVAGAVGALALGCGGSSHGPLIIDHFDGSVGPDGGVDGGGPDAAVSICPAGPCNLVDQDCGGDGGTGCYWNEPTDGGVAGPICAPAGQGADGDPCMVPNDCAAGLQCVGPTGMMGTCRTVCCLGSDAPCPGTTQCIIPIVGPSASDTGVGACAEPNACDLLNQNCSQGEGCYPSVKPTVTICFQSGMLVEGDPCTYSNECQAGLVCSDSVCTKVCDRSGATSGCQNTQTCVPLNGYPGGIGVCDPPM